MIVYKVNSYSPTAPVSVQTHLGYETRLLELANVRVLGAIGNERLSELVGSLEVNLVAESL